MAKYLTKIWNDYQFEFINHKYNNKQEAIGKAEQANSHAIVIEKEKIYDNGKEK